MSLLCLIICIFIANFLFVIAWVFFKTRSKRWDVEMHAVAPPPTQSHECFFTDGLMCSCSLKGMCKKAIEFQNTKQIELQFNEENKTAS